MNILLLGSQHGNELLGEYLYKHICSAKPELLSHVTYKVANPRAKKHGVRYIESDLNRSYSSTKNTYETRRAKRLLRQFADEKYDIILDLHTTACVQPPCIIVADIEANRQFLGASSIDKIVEMRHSIVASSLIGNIAKAVSIEINQEEAREFNILEKLCDDIARFIQNETSGRPKEIYDVRALLKKTEVSPAEATKLRNFTRSPLGFYPVLVGENSYKKQTDYLGFKASERTVREML